MTLTDREIHGVGFKLIIRSGSVSKEIQKAIKEGLKEVGEQYAAQIDKNISLSDHTLEDLRHLGYPYSTDKPENSVHGDDALLHEQTGKLRQSIRLQPVEQESSRVFSVYITSSDPILPYLIYGTTRMRPRRFHEKSYNDIKDKFWKPVIDKLKGVKYRISSSTE
jgi:hypothetical protein